MEDNEAYRQITLARILVNLGHSYLHTVDIENSDDESGESESGDTGGEETEGEEKEVQTKFKASKQQNIEEEEDQFDKQLHDKVIKQRELEKKTNLEDIPQQFYRDIQQKSYNNLPVEADTEKHELEKEVANKSNDKKHKLNTDLPKEFNNTIQQRLEYGVELIGEVQDEFSKKQEKVHPDDQPKIDINKEHECNEQLIKDSENEIQIQLLVEAPPMPGVDVELYLEVQVDSGCQLDIKKEKVLGEKQKNVNKDQETVVKNIEHTDHKDRQAVNKNVQIKFNEVNISQDIAEDTQDKINKGSKQNLEEEKIQPELNENLQEQYDNEVQHDVKELQQDDYEETMNTNHKRILQEIESLMCDFKNRKNEEEECDELTAIRIAKLTKEIEELEIDMEQKRDEELEREYNDEFKRMFSSVVKEKFLEKLLLSFNEDVAPYYKRIENLLGNYFPTKLDTINDKILIDPVHSKPHEDLKESSDISDGAFEEIQEEPDKISEDVEKGSNDEIYYFEEVPEESNMEMGELEDEVVQAVSDIENEDETQEESDVDVEGLSNPDDKVTGGLDWNLQIDSEINANESDGQSLQESDEEIEELNDDVNIVTEIVYDYEVEEEVESSSIEELSPIEESPSTDDEFNSTEIEQRNEEIHQKIGKEGQCISSSSSIHELQGYVQEKSDNDKPQNFEDLQLQMEIENIQDLDEIPLKLKIQQEEFEEKLHQQMKTFQEEFYKNSKLEYEKEQQLKGNTLIDPIYDREQKLFYKIKGNFLKTTDKYKDLAQQKMIEALQQKVDEKQLLEMKEFPEEFVEPNIEIEDLHKEVLQLQRECDELEPEFSYNIPLVVDEKPSNNRTKKVKYNLYNKLHEIHKKKLCFFADSKEWPEKYLYPSCLLDELFDDPSEVNPNVFVITLFSVDIGYSIKITMNKNKPPVETFYSYADDSILDFVEREQLPPCLLDLFDEARPRLFYNGRVIAEIHNKYHGEDSTRIYRILLHPHNLSIQSDVDRIIAKCSPAYCSYEQRLKIESQLLLRNFPVMCIDSSPIAGLTVQLQHQLLSRRTITLNPLKVKNNDSSNFEMYVSKKLEDDRLNESQNESTKLMKDTASENTIHHLLWKFEFRIHTFKIIKLYVFVITETLEYSMLLCMNSIVPRSKKMRFKINLKTNKLKSYIDVILEFLKKNVNPDTLVVRRYKSDDKSVPQSTTCVPSLLNDNVYEPSSTDICKFLDELLEFIPKIESEETDVTKRCLYYGVSEKVKSKKKDINFGSSKRVSKNIENKKNQKRKKRVQDFELKNVIPRKVESLSTSKISIDSKSLKSSIIPIDVSLGLKSLPTKSLNPVKPLLTGSKSNALLDNRSFNVVYKELDTNSAKKILLVSSPMTILPTVSSHITVVSLQQSFTDAALPPESSTATIKSLAPRYKTIFSSAALNTDYRLASKNSEKFENPSVNKDIKSKPVILSKADYNKCLRKNYFSLETSFGKINSRPPLRNFGRRLRSCDDEMENNIKIVKHVHRNGICLKGPEFIINKEGLSVAAKITEGRLPNERNATYSQETKQLNDDLTTNIDSLSNLQVTSPNPVITLVPSSLNKFNNQDQMNDISFQEINYTSSSSTENIKSVKRKRSS